MEEIIDNIKCAIIEISDMLRNDNTFNLSQESSVLNDSGDNIKKCDERSNDIFIKNLKNTSSVKALVSEEEYKIIYTNNPGSNYLVCFDPLDGSTNINCNITTGSIFSIFNYSNIDSGHDVICSGYSLYGASTQLCLAYQNSVNFYQLSSNNFSKNFFKIIKSNHKIPYIGAYYSINYLNEPTWSSLIKTFVNQMVDKRKNMRYAGSLVGDAHRILINGGSFIYPKNKENKNAKIRLLYEAYPMAHIFKCAGGFSHNENNDILDVSFPKNIHEKTSIILLGKSENELLSDIHRSL